MRENLQNQEVPEAPVEKNETHSELYTDAMRMRPASVDTSKVLAELTGSLEELAQRAGLSVQAFLAKAETDPNFCEDYLIALTTARHIARLNTR